jgi:hypothetical protein
MLVMAADWETVSSLATGAGTLVLAVATFAAVRSSNRSARVAEVALREQRRPLLTPSRIADPEQRMMFADRHWVKSAGGQGTAEHIDGSVYLAISLRNVGNGIAVCQAWVATPSLGLSLTDPQHAPIDRFRPQARDLYIPAGDVGMWQGVLRDRDDPLRATLAAAVDASEPVTVELLYSDLLGGQRTVTRFTLLPKADVWYASMSRHWYLDWDGPRPGAAAGPPLSMTAEELLRSEGVDPGAEAGTDGDAAS